MRATRTACIAAAVALTASCTAACSSSGGSGGSGGKAPSNISFIVDTGPGGGSDLFARQILKIAKDNKLISSNWPVVSQPEGGGLGAMAYMKGKPSQGNYVSAFTSKWIIAALSTPNAPAQLTDLTPIAEIADETQVIAAPANAPLGIACAANAEPRRTTKKPTIPATTATMLATIQAWIMNPANTTQTVTGPPARFDRRGGIEFWRRSGSAAPPSPRPCRPHTGRDSRVCGTAGPRQV